MKPAYLVFGKRSDFTRKWVTAELGTGEGQADSCCLRVMQFYSFRELDKETIKESSVDREREMESDRGREGEREMESDRGREGEREMESDRGSEGEREREI